MKIKLNKKFTQRWSGDYTFISCSFWGPQYYKKLKQILGVNFANTIFIHKQGTVDFYVATEQLHALGKVLAKKTNAQSVKKFSELIIENTDKLVSIMHKLKGKIPTWQEYQNFLRPFENHLAYHGFIKETVDYLPQDKLKKFFKIFKYARQYSERIYSDSETFFRSITEAMAKQNKRNKNLLTCLTQNEFENYLKNQELPPNALLKKRFKKSCLYFDKGQVKYLFGTDVDRLEKKLVENNLKNTAVLQGIPAFPGKVSGVCRIVTNPNDSKGFKSGEILVTGMTRPEFIPLIKKAAAIVTDSGGILSHAAITAREFKIPCVVGTQIASKILKKGQKILVDGEKAIIKILK